MAASHSSFRRGAEPRLLACVVPLTASLLAFVWMVPAARQPDDGFGWFRPWVEIDADDIRTMDRGEIVAKTLPAAGSEISVFLAGAINTSPDRFIDAVRHPEALWTAPRVPRVGRFSMPPRMEDVEEMELDRRDVDAIRHCVPGDCDVKLTAAEMQRLKMATSIEDEFRQVVVDRVKRYLEGGLLATGALHDHATPIDPAAMSARLLKRSPWLTERAPRLAQYIEDFPSATLRNLDSVVYWREITRTPKPTIQIVHVTIARRAALGAVVPDALVVSRQVFASHYINSSLSVSILFQDRTKSRRYLAYVNRIHVDGLDGWLGGLRRLLVERSVRGTGAAGFGEQLQRIEAWTASEAPRSQ